MPVLLDLVRLFAGVTVLSFAAYTDWQWRRAPNVLWPILGAVGVVALAAEAALDPDAFLARWPNLLFIPLFAALVYALWYVGLIAGGADAKALMALGLLLPYPVRLAEGMPRWSAPVAYWPAAAAVLGNALLLFLAVPVGFLVWNALRGHLRLPHALLGVKRPARDVQRGHVWPMEVVDEKGRRSTRLFPARIPASEIDELFARVQALGDERVWVTPKIPFMVPLLAGFVAAFGLGDLLFALVARLV